MSDSGDGQGSPINQEKPGISKGLLRLILILLVLGAIAILVAIVYVAIHLWAWYQAAWLLSFGAIL